MRHLLARLFLPLPLSVCFFAQSPASAQQFVPADVDNGIVLPAINAAESRKPAPPVSTVSRSSAANGSAAGKVSLPGEASVGAMPPADIAAPPTITANGQPFATGLVGHECCGCMPLGYFRAEALWLDRRRTRNQTLSILDNPGIANDQVVLSTNDIKFGYEPGLRIVLGQMISPNWAVEGVYFGLHDHDGWAATPTGAADGVAVFGVMQPYWANTGLGPIGSLAQAIDNPTLGFTNAWQHAARYSSELHNVELNLRQFVTPNISWLVGFRYVNVDEQFDFTSIDQNPAAAGAEGPGGGIYSVDTDNHLVGLQAGGEFVMPLFGDWLRLGAHGKAGIFMNFAEQSSRLFTTLNNENTPQNTFTGRAEQTRVSTLVEVGLSASVRVTRAIWVRAGYDVFFINGLALAPENLAAAPYVPGALNILNANGNAIYHGPSVGVQVNW